IARNHIVDNLVADEAIALGENLSEIAANLYHALRTFKQSNVDIIICEAFPEKGIGQAVMNRLKKAASNYIYRD
ncbi:Sua5 family C-terminal domain-containing protein, partial [Virgibacillus salexigens]|uniref:Sua5 family C-terminal domain-containing protein n=1 Tax=Virgibacillus massiliensis TaxID=1462526 RepID=UPI0027BA16FC